MRASLIVLISVSCLSACASLPGTRKTAYLPPGVYGVYQDNDVGAINQAAWAFSSPANTRGNPITAIKAIVAVEYLSGELRENPRWLEMDGSVKYRMTVARDDLRKILGIRLDAPAQVVVDALLWTAAALSHGDQATALRVLSGPEFTLSPPDTLRLLTNLPYVQTANLASSRAENQSFADGGVRS